MLYFRQSKENIPFLSEISVGTLFQTKMAQKPYPSVWGRTYLHSYTPEARGVVVVVCSVSCASADCSTTKLLRITSTDDHFIRFQLLLSWNKTGQVVWKISSSGWISTHGRMARICFLELMDFKKSIRQMSWSILPYNDKFKFKFKLDHAVLHQTQHTETFLLPEFIKSSLYIADALG